jgi:hypothetical protein
MRRFENNQPVALEWLDNSFLSDESKNQFKAIIALTYAILAKKIKDQSK